MSECEALVVQVDGDDVRQARCGAPATLRVDAKYRATDTEPGPSYLACVPAHAELLAAVLYTAGYEVAVVVPCFA